MWREKEDMALFTGEAVAESRAPDARRSMARGSKEADTSHGQME